MKTITILILSAFVMMPMAGCKKKDTEDREDTTIHKKDGCLLMNVSEQFANMPDIVSSHFYSYNHQKQLISDSIPGYVELYVYNENNLIERIDRYSNGRYVSYVDFYYQDKNLKSVSTYMDYGGAFDLVTSSVFKYENNLVKREEIWDGHIDEPLTMIAFTDYTYTSGNIASATVYTLENDSSFKPKSRTMYTFSDINSDTTLNIYLLKDPIYFQNKKIFSSTQKQNFISTTNSFENPGIIEERRIEVKSPSEIWIENGNFKHTFIYTCK